MAGELTLMAETYLWGLQGICQLQRIPFTPHLVQQQFPPPYSLTSLQQAATALGLKSGLRDALAAELPELPVPFIAVLKPPAASRNSIREKSILSVARLLEI